MEVIQVEEKYYIVATSSRLDDRTRVLKQGETFGVFDRFGDIAPVGLGELGLYYEGTRFLSRFGLTLGTERLLLLSSTVSNDNAHLWVDLTNADITQDGEVVIPRGTLHVSRERHLWESGCYEQLRVANYGPHPVTAALHYGYAADFADIFEVRGTQREARGKLLTPHVGESAITLSYEGRDGMIRRTRLFCDPQPTRISDSELMLSLALGPGEERSYWLACICETGNERPPFLSHEVSKARARASLEEARSQDCHIYTGNEQFNDWLNRSVADLHLMVTETPCGPYPYAGVPWFSTIFGRDGIITALETLWINPGIARGVLRYLATTQARTHDGVSEAEPGKILHEMRKGEMAATGEVPFARYYGSVDATPLFVVLAAAYVRHTGDYDLVRELWPNIDLALNWLSGDGDPDQDGFVEYHRHTEKGLLHQGWKDSRDSVFHADGSSAEAPIALCEVQGYAYAARREGAWLAGLQGFSDRAAELTREADSLREKFEASFWSESNQSYVLALDGRKRPCDVLTSNAGHCLWSGVAAPERAARVVERLMQPDFYSGWGIRTVAAGQPRYNPMSYHNGSVWPHDNALISAGFARYGFKNYSMKLLGGLFDAALFIDLHRMPELFCGFARRHTAGPTLYPVACAPQSWAAGSVFLLLQACLGLVVDGAEQRVTFERPMLPEFLPEVVLRKLQVGQGFVDIRIRRYPHDVGITVLDRREKVEVVVLK
ncbi:MAG TPA: amylo-alpha-1,6-glucosidase [Candidatus Eisenbacteria bacterium]|nr:amylo-alpha-1,6-glucosidase [Candidatus Eisenbacteria bacterium]